MALSGSLLADFSTFTAACAQAEVSLKGFESNSAKTEAQLNRMVDSLSGRKIVQDAGLMAEAVDRIGGVSKLTETQLAKVSAQASEAAAKLSAMGQDVPPGIQKIADQAKSAGLSLDTMKGAALGIASAFGIAFSVGAVVQFGKALIDDAGALVDLSQKTGHSIEQLQRFAFVGSQANVSVDDLAQASFKLGVALEGGDKSVVQAVGRLGLNYQALKAQSPDDQFNATAKALEGMIDPQERNRIGVELFGKSFATIAPAISKGYTDMAAAAKVSSTAQIKAIDDNSDAWDLFYAKQKTKVTSWLGDFAIAQEQLGKLTEEQKKVYQALVTAADFVGAQSYLILLSKQHDIELPKQEKHLSLTKDEQAAQEKLAAAMEELNSVGKGWQGTLDTISGSVVEAIKYYLAAGVSQSALATAYGLTAAQVNAVGTAVKDAAEATKGWDEINKQSHALALKLFQQEEEASKKRTALTNAQVLAELAARKTLNDEYVENQTTLDRLRLAMDALHATAVTGFSQKRQEQVLNDQYTKSLYDQAIAQDVLRNALSNTNSAMQASIALKMAAIQLAANQAIDLTANAQAAGSGGAGTLGMQTPIYVSPSLYSTPINAGSQVAVVQKRGMGGPVSAGSSYLVGDGGGPELFTPGANGFITPTGGGGSTSVVINLYGTPAELAQQVKAIVTRDIMQGRKL